MPIAVEERARYGPDWRRISDLVRFGRACGCCEQCGAPHGEIILREPGTDRWVLEGPLLLEESDRYERLFIEWSRTQVVLTTAHLSEPIEALALEGLRAWCQRCHLKYDMRRHVARRRRNRARRAGQLLLDALEEVA